MSLTLPHRLFSNKIYTRLPFRASVRTLSGRTYKPASIPKTALSAAALLTGTTLFVFYYLDSRSAIHRYVFPSLFRTTLDPETAQKTAVKILRSGWGPKDKGVDDERLVAQLWGEQLSNPIGLAAGFDKDGEAIDGLFDLGFGWVEIGSVTPKPQPGNPCPRVFHLQSEHAIINRYGFPSKGHAALASRLRAREARSSQDSSQMLSINLGKNKSSPPESIEDFLSGIRTFAPHAHVLVINVSSPNTPGLRALQQPESLGKLLDGATRELNSVNTISGRQTRLVLKISPDLTEDEICDLADVVRTSGVDGVIVSNTTVARPVGLKSPEKSEQGGLSGPPLKPLTLRTLSHLRTLLPASIPIIGCGGISSGTDALDYARAGATAVQIYTAFGYGGVGTVRRIKDELTAELQRFGTTWFEVSREAVGRKAWKAPVESSSQGVGTLIHEAEQLKKMLDDLAGRLYPESEGGEVAATGPTEKIAAGDIQDV